MLQWTVFNNWTLIQSQIGPVISVLAMSYQRMSSRKIQSGPFFKYQIEFFLFFCHYHIHGYHKTVEDPALQSGITHFTHVLNMIIKCRTLIMNVYIPGFTGKQIMSRCDITA